MNAHQRTVGKNDNRFTPRWILEPLGPFETDAATADVRPWSIGRRLNLTPIENCLERCWRRFGRTWLNPPFNRYGVAAFVRKMIEHGHGTMLLHVRTETDWFRPIWGSATALFFLGTRVVFCKPDGSPCTIDDPESKHYGKSANSGAPVVLVAFGFDDADRLDGSGLEGSFVPLAFRRFVAISAIELAEASKTWRELVEPWLRAMDGPVRTADLYRAFALHPRARASRHYKAKLRQTLQRGAGRRVGPDQWVAV